MPAPPQVAGDVDSGQGREDAPEPEGLPGRPTAFAKDQDAQGGDSARGRLIGGFYR
jgi:hypothetical protein